MGHVVGPGWFPRAGENPGAFFQSALLAAAAKPSSDGETNLPSLFCSWVQARPDCLA